MLSNTYLNILFKKDIKKYLNIEVIIYKNKYDKDILLTFYNSQKNRSSFNNIVLKYIELKLY